ncbi:MAG: hypothetical protein RL113_1473 [Pseudomonadota bacterium]
MNSKTNKKIKDALSTGFFILLGIAFAMLITAPLSGASYAEEYANENLQNTGLKIEKITNPEPMPFGYVGSAVLELKVNPYGSVEEYTYEGDKALASNMIEAVKNWQFESKEEGYIVRIPVISQ